MDDKLNHNEIYLTNIHKTYLLTSTDIERFIVMYLFPLEIIPPLAIVYLKEKHRHILEYLSEYILINNSSSEEAPINKEELGEIISKAIIETGINVGNLRKYDDEKVIEWHNIRVKERRKNK